MPSVAPLKPVRKAAVGARKAVVRLRKPLLKVELTAEDLALDNAISAAAARSLAFRRT